MATISAKLIKNPRKSRYCDDCEEDNGLLPIVRLYGYACNGDPKYNLYICVECAKKSARHSENHKILSALRDGGIECSILPLAS